MKENYPTKPGLYWAKSASFKWWNLIVEVYGDAPFLKIRGWDRTKNAVYKYETSDIAEWGPEIEDLNK